MAISGFTPLSKPPKPPDLKDLPPAVLAYLEQLYQWSAGITEVSQRIFRSVDQECETRGTPTTIPSAAVAELTGANPKYKPITGGNYARLVACRDAVGGPTLCVSDGLIWIDVRTGVAVV